MALKQSYQRSKPKRVKDFFNAVEKPKIDHESNYFTRLIEKNAK